LYENSYFSAKIQIFWFVQEKSDFFNGQKNHLLLEGEGGEIVFF
jgi:hypothetical protein